MSLTTPAPLGPGAQQRTCFPWEGRPSEYQGEAKVILAATLGGGHEVPWIYVVPVCDTPMCLQRLHLRYFHAKRIAYPDYVCVYCGMPGYTKDHLLPVSMTGEALRKFVAVVPACLECNSGIGSRIGHHILERRAEAHRLIEKKNRKYLDIKQLWTAEKLAELGPNLRAAVKAGLDRAEVTLARLAWPHDPGYDRRAFEKSGFDDPIGMELL